MTAKTRSGRSFPLATRWSPRNHSDSRAQPINSAPRKMIVRTTTKRKSGRTRKPKPVKVRMGQVLQRLRSPRNPLDSRAQVINTVQRKVTVSMTAKTRSGRAFPVSRKRKPATVRMNQGQFLQRRRSPRDHMDSKAHDRKFKNFFREETRRRRRQKERQELRERESEEDGTEDEVLDYVVSPRRSNRNIQNIKLQGTAWSFYGKLRKLFFSNPSDEGYQSIGGNRIQWQRMHNNPPIYVIDDFLTPSELEHFDSRVTDLKFERSFVDNMVLDEIRETDDSAQNHGRTSEKRQRRTIVDSTHRTSTFFGFKKMHDAKISSLERRIATLLGCWEEQIEPLQLVRYLPGEFFNVHHDMGDLVDNDQVNLPKKHPFVKRRVLTLFFYLNTLTEDQGGCTHFPKCNDLRVQPKRGRLVIWSNVTEDGFPDPRTIHAGEPVISDEEDFAKYGLNLWVCEE